MTDPRPDEFEVFLRRRSILGGQDSTPDKLEPPHDLDNIVLGKARQAIRATTPLPLYRAPRWALPVALAATLLLTLSVALNVGLKVNGHPAAAGSVAAASRGAQSLTQAPSAPAAQVAAPQAAANDAYSAPQRESLAAAAKRAASVAADRPQDPQAWLQRIASLRAAGRTAQADAEMRRFRSAFPSFPVTTSTDPASAPPK
jgi:hypothetical protein